MNRFFRDRRPAPVPRTGWLWRTGRIVLGLSMLCGSLIALAAPVVLGAAMLRHGVPARRPGEVLAGLVVSGLCLALAVGGLRGRLRGRRAPVLDGEP